MSCPIYDYLEGPERNFLSLAEWLALAEAERKVHVAGHPDRFGVENCNWCYEEFLIEHQFGNDVEDMYAYECATSGHMPLPELR